MDETETESAVAKQVVVAIVAVVGLTVGIVALFNLSVSYRKNDR